MSEQAVKRLYRSRSDRIVAGVCGGFAKYAGIDPTVVRLVFVILTVFTALFGGVLAYVLALLIVPEEPASAYAPVPTAPQAPPPQF
ncbi:MAG TPA: PspC domain-containing protein [Candidatus Thermoplasmatota archaeon]|nr:PspC domain-containing protein [Candidatus Thermoplasmatota archaeon]